MNAIAISASLATLSEAQTAQISTTCIAHSVFSSATTELFRWFEEAVKGPAATDDIEAKLVEVDAKIASCELPAILTNEWAAYKKSLSNAYADFGRDVITRMGVDEPNQVRMLARSIAAGAFKRTRDRARDELVRSIESATSV